MQYTLVPLGNKGKEYEKTRHNAARFVLTNIATETLPCEVFIPDSYMNESGKALLSYIKYHDDRTFIVMYDDKDLPIGKFRISFDRGDGGHNGVKSIIEALGTKEFIRVRIGIAPKEVDGREVKAPHGEEVQDYVLGIFTKEEQNELHAISKDVHGALAEIVTNGYQKAMEKFN